METTWLKYSPSSAQPSLAFPVGALEHSRGARSTPLLDLAISGGRIGVTGTRAGWPVLAAASGGCAQAPQPSREVRLSLWASPRARPGGEPGSIMQGLVCRRLPLGLSPRAVTKARPPTLPRAIKQWGGPRGALPCRFHERPAAPGGEWGYGVGSGDRGCLGSPLPRLAAWQALIAHSPAGRTPGHHGVGVGVRVAGGGGQRPGHTRLPREQIPSQGELRQGSSRCPVTQSRGVGCGAVPPVPTFPGHPLGCPGPNPTLFHSSQGPGMPWPRRTPRASFCRTTLWQSSPWMRMARWALRPRAESACWSQWPLDGFAPLRAKVRGASPDSGWREATTPCLT